MNLWFAMVEGWGDILSHKLRSLLTVLGVVFGVASLMTMLAITAGMASNMKDALLNTGDGEKIAIRPAAPPESQREIAARSPGLTYRDVEALRGSSPLITWIGYSSNYGGWFRYLDRSSGGQVVGTGAGYLEMDRMEVRHGRFLTDLDQETMARVVVLGSRIWKELFPQGAEGAIGRTIQIRGVNFTVVGTFPEYLTPGQQRAAAQGITRTEQERRQARGGRGRQWDPYPWKNQVAVIPLSTMQAIFKSVNMQDGVDQGPDERLTQIQVGISDPARKRELAEHVERVLLFTHRGIQDFSIETHEDRVDQVEAEVRATRLSGGIIAGIGLVVGGVGITNIMLAGIVDRIRELGVRLAVGARPWHLFLQVLVEAVLLALLGGILGVVTGLGMVYVLDKVLMIPTRPVMEEWAVGLSFAFALVTGIVAGIYPAWKASQLKPVEALKFD